jgi:hypothetical protein
MAWLFHHKKILQKSYNMVVSSQQIQASLTETGAVILATGTYNNTTLTLLA